MGVGGSGRREPDADGGRGGIGSGAAEVDGIGVEDGNTGGVGCKAIRSDQVVLTVALSDRPRRSGGAFFVCSSSTSLALRFALARRVGSMPAGVMPYRAEGGHPFASSASSW